MEFLPILPELYVTSFKASLHFYVNILGFKVEHQRHHPNFAFLSYQEGKIAYGCREILVTDPDGYLLRFSEDLGEKRSL